MTTTLENKISEYSQMINDRFNEMIRLAKMTGAKRIESKDFFMKVINSYFEEMSKGKANKCVTSYSTMCYEMNKACEKAEYACAKPAREENKQYFI